MEVQMMGGLKLEAEERIETTTVSNLFIDRYMPRANGEYIKIYLLLLRHFQTPDWELSVSSMADYLDCTEKDVRRGLSYWEREGVLSLRFDPDKKLSGIRLLDLQAKIVAAVELASNQVKAESAASETNGGRRPQDRPDEQESAADGEVMDKAPVKPLHEMDGVVHDMSQLSRDEAFSQLVSLVSAYKKKPLSHDDCDIYMIRWGCRRSCLNIWWRPAWRAGSPVCGIWKRLPLAGMSVRSGRRSRRGCCRLCIARICGKL